MRSSWLLFLPTDEQAVSFFPADGQDLHFAVFRVNVVEDPETVIRTEPKLPTRFEGGGALHRLSVPGFAAGLESQRLVDRRADQGVVLWLYGPEMLFHF